MALSAARREDRRRNIIAAAHSLLRERGDDGFTMTELAARAGVSPATPYNLVGSKAEVLRSVVKDEFRCFIDKLAQLEHRSPLQSLLDATALVVSHYESDRAFYRALYRMTVGADAPEVYDVMQAEGRVLWQGLVQAAVDAGELTQLVRVRPFTDVLLRAIASVTLDWLAANWRHARFEQEMALSVLLITTSTARADLQPNLLERIGRAERELHALTASRVPGRAI